MIEQQVQSTRGGLAHDLLPSSSFILKSGLVMIAVGLGCLLLGGFLASQLMLLGDLGPGVRTILRICGAVDLMTGTVVVVVLNRRTRGVRSVRHAGEVALLVVLVVGGFALVPPALAAAVLLLEILIQLVVLGFVLLFGAAFALLVLRRS